MMEGAWFGGEYLKYAKIVVVIRGLQVKGVKFWCMKGYRLNLEIIVDFWPGFCCWRESELKRGRKKIESREKIGKFCDFL